MSMEEQNVNEITEVSEIAAVPEVSGEMESEAPAAPEVSGEMPETTAPSPAPDPEREIAQRIAAAVAEERARWEAELAQQRDALEREQQMVQRLREAGLDTGFAPLLCGQDREQDGERFDTFQTLYRQAVQAGVLRQLRVDELPKAPQKPTVYDRETLKHMSPGEINARWAEIAGQLKNRT